MSDPTPEDILALARFCWPETDWRVRHLWPITESRLDVAAAEAALVERGLGHEYVNEMLRIYDDDYQEEWIHTYDSWALVAPLDARVRAMIAVVRAQEAKP